MRWFISSCWLFRLVVLTITSTRCVSSMEKSNKNEQQINGLLHLVVLPLSSCCVFQSHRVASPPWCVDLCRRWTRAMPSPTPPGPQMSWRDSSPTAAGALRGTFRVCTVPWYNVQKTRGTNSILYCNNTTVIVLIVLMGLIGRQG